MPLRQIRSLRGPVSAATRDLEEAAKREAEKHVLEQQNIAQGVTQRQEAEDRLQETAAQEEVALEEMQHYQVGIDGSGIVGI